MTYDMTHKMYNVENENNIIKMKIQCEIVSNYMYVSCIKN